MKIILLESIDEAKYFTERREEAYFKSDGIRVISLSPKVEVFLKNKGIPCENTVTYFNNNSHKRIVEQIETCIRSFFSRVRFEDENNVSKAYEHFFFHHLRYYLSYCFMSLEILKNIAVQHNITEMITVDSKGQCREQAFLDPGDGFLSAVVEKFCRQENIPSTREKGFRVSGGKESSGFLGRVATFFVRRYFRIYYRLIKRHLSDSRQPYVIVPTWGYKFDDLVQEIKRKFPHSKIILLIEEGGHLKRNIRLIWFSLAKIFPFFKRGQLFDFVIPVDLLSSAWEKKEDPIFRQSVEDLNVVLEKELLHAFNFCGVDLSSLVLHKIKHGLLKEMKRLQRRVSSLKVILKHVHPKVVISPYSTGFYYALGELSTLLGIESCVITHGTHVPPNNKYEEIEDYWLAKGVVLNDYRTVAMQSPWAKKFLNHFNDNRNFLYTGPLIFSQRQNGNRINGVNQKTRISGQKNILYAATQRDHFRMRFYITETLDEFLESLKDIVSAISQNPNLHLLLRPHPACELSGSDFKCLLPESEQISVVTGGKFEDVLSITDLLISYSSTCIEDALVNNIPVILYDRWCRYNHFNIKQDGPHNELLQMPAVYIDRQTKLKEYLLRFSKNWDVPSQAFDEYRYPREWNENFYHYVGECLEDKNK
jgi:hypothetical protein